MNQPEIVRCLEKLIPSITASKDPEGVMLKYARDQRLSCAVLEKLAQTYNIAKTLNFMDKSADRTGSFSVLDPGPLLQKYSAYAPPVSAKRDDASEWFDVREKCASARVPSPAELEEMSKAASAESDITLLHDSAAAEYRKQANARLDGETLEQIAFDHEQFALTKLAMIRGAIAEGVFDYSTLDHDLRDMRGDSAADRIHALPMFAKLAAAPHKPRLGRDRTGYALTAIAALEDLDIAREATKMAADGVRFDNSVRDVSGVPDEADGIVSPKVPRSEESPKPAKAPAGPKYPSGEGDKKSPVRDAVLDTIKRVLQKDTYGATFSPYTGVKALADETKPGESHRTRMLHEQEETLDDDAGMMHLQRFMASDPVISKHDPSEVVALYNSIKSSDPKLTRDPSGLKFTLREALQYGSMPLHTTKELLTVSDLRGKATKNHLGNTETLATKF